MIQPRRTTRFMLCALCALALILTIGAYAASTVSLDAQISITPEKIKNIGDEISVTITVKNTSGSDMQNGVSLLNSDATPIGDFGVNGTAILAKDETTSVTFSHTVTQQDISAGYLSFLLRCPMVDDEGEVVNWQKQLKKEIAFDGTVVNLTAERTITPEVARKSGTVTVTYTLVNSGTVDITDIKVQETIIKTAQTVKSLKVGTSATVTFTTKMGSEALTSSAVIQYKANGESGEVQVGSAQIPLAEPSLTMTVTGPEDGVNIGEEAKVTVTFENRGNVSYNDISITDSVKGVLFSGLSVAAGQTASFDTTVVLDGPTDLNLAAALKDNTGTASTLNQKLHINAYDPEKAVRLTLTLTSSEIEVTTLPSTLTFRLVVTNDSNVTAKNISISHGYTTGIASITELAPGESRVVQRSIKVSYAGQFRFTASCADSLGNTVTFDSNTITISKKAPAAAATDVPRATNVPHPTAVPAETDVTPYVTKANTFYNAHIFIGMAAAAITLLIIAALITRLARKLHSNAAYDHMKRGQHIDYTAPAGTRAAQAQDEESFEIPADERATVDYRGSDRNDEVDLENDNLTIGAVSPVSKEAKPAAKAVQESPEKKDITEAVRETKEQTENILQQMKNARHPVQMHSYEDDE